MYGVRRFAGIGLNKRVSVNIVVKFPNFYRTFIFSWLLFASLRGRRPKGREGERRAGEEREDRKHSLWLSSLPFYGLSLRLSVCPIDIIAIVSSDRPTFFFFILRSLMYFYLFFAVFTWHPWECQRGLRKKSFIRRSQEDAQALVLTSFLLSFISSSSCFIVSISLAENEKSGAEK